MNSTIELLTQTRTNFLNLISEMSLEEVNQIPSNFNNNIIWNLGHIIVTQQILIYQLSGLTPKLDTKPFEKYRKGTKPEAFIGEDEYSHLKNIAVPLIKEFGEDYQKGIFTNFTPYPTSYGVKLTNISEAVQFVAVHESLHLGYAMALKRAIK